MDIIHYEGNGFYIYDENKEIKYFVKGARTMSSIFYVPVS